MPFQTGLGRLQPGLGHAVGHLRAQHIDTGPPQVLCVRHSPSHLPCLSHRTIHRWWINHGRIDTGRGSVQRRVGEVEGPSPRGRFPEVQNGTTGVRGEEQETCRVRAPMSVPGGARRARVAAGSESPLAWIDRSGEHGRPDRAGEAMSEAHVSTEQPETGQAPRVPSPDVDKRRQGHPVRPSAQGSSAPVGLIWSIRDRTTFGTLRRSGRRVRRGPVTVTWVPGDPSDPPRVAYAVGRMVGGAVVRNRVKRRLRAISQEARPLLHSGAYLVGVNAKATSLSYRDLRATVFEALGALDAPGSGSSPSSPAAPAPATK